MKEDEIRKREIFNEYLRLSSEDAKIFFKDTNQFVKLNSCIACNSQNLSHALVKNNFNYVECGDCDTFFVNPRPTIDMLSKYYSSSPSTTFWVEKFFKPVAEKRREKIFRPRAEYISKFLKRKNGITIGDIGAGFGIFLEELKNKIPENKFIAIEPSKDMADICRNKGLIVIEDILENLSFAEHKFDVLLSFELFEHLQDPKSFLTKVKDLLNNEGIFIFTTLNGLGFDIQNLWNESKSISPPHHLNFFNPWSIKKISEIVGFEVIECSTPGKLDWDIIEGGIKNSEIQPGRFWTKFSKYADEDSKESLQGWISKSNFSSHMRVILRKKQNG
ncbi:MAG: class I SAM-dependent methyltransferase [Candidatus Hodarchaeota archaeon]